MRKLFLTSLAATFVLMSCGKSSGSCGTHNGHQLYKGSDGGCYYINSNGNKTYVDRNECHC